MCIRVNAFIIEFRDFDKKIKKKISTQPIYWIKNKRLCERICDFTTHKWIQSESSFVCDENTVASFLQLLFKIQFMLINHTLPRETIWAWMIFNIDVGFFLLLMLNHFIQTKVFKNPNSTITFFLGLSDQINEKEKGKKPILLWMESEK